MADLFKANVSFDASEVLGNLGDLKDRLRGALLEAGEIIAGRVETYAKKSAIWVDRTSNARQGLTGKAVMEGTKLIVYLFHTMTYGKWLEVAMKQKYAVIMAALNHYYPQLLRMAQRLVMGT